MQDAAVRTQSTYRPTKMLIACTEGGVGKTMLAREASARLQSPLISIERANADGHEEQVLRGSRFGHLAAYLPTTNRVVVDIGASEFTSAWAEVKKYFGVLEQFQRVVVPVKAEPRAQSSCINTIDALRNEGVPQEKIFVVLNMVTADQADDIKGAFRILYAHHRNAPFSIARIAISENEVHARARAMGLSIDAMADDPTDYQELILASPQSPDVPEWGVRVAARWLARRARSELDAVFNELLGARE